MSSSDASMAWGLFDAGTSLEEITCTTGTYSEVVCWTARQCLTVSWDKSLTQVFSRPESESVHPMVLGLFAVPCFLSFCSIIKVLFHRKKPVLRLTQWQLLLLLAVGCLLACIGLFLDLLGAFTYLPGICYAHFSLFYIGLLFILLSLFFKVYISWRVNKSSGAAGDSPNLQNDVLVKFMIAMVPQVVGLLAGWFLFYPIQYNPCEIGHLQCSTAAFLDDFDLPYPAIIIWALLGLGFLMTLVYSFRAIEMPSVAYESLSLFVSSLLFTIILLVSVAFDSNLISSGGFIRGIVTSVCFGLTTILTLALIIESKQRHFGLSEDQVRTKFSLPGSGSSQGAAAAAAEASAEDVPCATPLSKEECDASMQTPSDGQVVVTASMPATPFARGQAADEPVHYAVASV